MSSCGPQSPKAGTDAAATTGATTMVQVAAEGGGGTQDPLTTLSLLLLPLSHIPRLILIHFWSWLLVLNHLSCLPVHIPPSLSLPYSFAVSLFSSTVFIIPRSVTMFWQFQRQVPIPRCSRKTFIHVHFNHTLEAPTACWRRCSQGWEGVSWFLPQPCPDLLGDLGSLLRCQLQHLYIPQGIETY